MPLIDTTNCPLPLWQSHKKVSADKIVDVTRPPGENQPYAFHLEGGIVRHVDHNWCCRHCVWNPSTTEEDAFKVPLAVGGYFVEYEDGYSSWSPAKAFEEGYTRI